MVTTRRCAAGPARGALALLLLGGLLSGCGKGKGIEAELANLRGGGHTLSEFKDSDPKEWHAQRCQSGTIDKLAATLCEYVSAEAATLGQGAGDAWIGRAHSGTVLRRELILIGLADRDRVDVNGKALAAAARTIRRAPKKS